MRSSTTLKTSRSVSATEVQSTTQSLFPMEQAGLLSQTLSSSPNTKFILPARLRSALFNDVVFVGHTAIQLRQFTQQGELTEVIAELGLGTQILGAKVISAPSHVVNVEDAILEHGRDEVRYTIRGQPLDDTQPPQILVLSIATGELVYTYARQSYNGFVQFVYAKRPILGTIPWPGKYGQHLAIDNESRALAVASMDNSFSILSLRDVDQIKEDIDVWDPQASSPLQPLYEQRFIQVDGVILRMDFLRSSKPEPRRVILLLLVANAGITRLLAYRWDSWRSLATIKPLRSSGQQLPSQDAFPYLLIPSCTEASFTLVTKTDVVFYRDVTSSHPHRSYAPLKPLEKDRGKVWVQWARPARHHAYQAANEDVWLFREDGLMRPFITELDPNKRTPTQFDVNVGIPVDAAVCALPAPPTMGGDILIICGDMAAGGVYHVMAKEQPSFLQSIPNLSPMHDAIVAEERPVAHKRSKRYALLATAGRTDMAGSISELRYGQEAQIRLRFAYDSAQTVTDTWTVEQRDGEHLLIIVSHHEHTTVMCYESSSEELAFINESTLSGFDFECQTLAIGHLSCNSILQISRQGLAIASTAPENYLSDISIELRDHVVCACIEEASGSFALIKRHGPNKHELWIGRVLAEHQDGQVVQIDTKLDILDQTPVFVTYASSNRAAVCVIASEDQKLHPLLIEADGSVHTLTPITCPAAATEAHSLSLSGLSSLTTLNGRIFVICGFKSGEAWYGELEFDTGGAGTQAVLHTSRMDKLGQTAVTVKVGHDTSNENGPHALLACEGVLHSVKLFANTAAIDYQIDDVWLADRHDPTFCPAAISSVSAISRPVARHAGHAHNLLLFAVGNEILLTQCSPPRLVPRTIRDISGAKQMVWSSHLKKLIAVVERPSRHIMRAATVSEASRPSLQVFDPALQEEGDTETEQPEFKLSANEDVRCLLNWAPTDGERHFDVIVIGSNIGEDGRLAYMSARKMAEQAAEVKAKIIANFSGKQIRAMCAFGLSTLAVGVGRHVKLLHLDVNTKKWTQPASFELPSPATSIAAKGSVIYVGTSLHSFLLLREHDKKLTVVSSDQWAGKARNIVPYGSASVVTNLISDSGSRILGFADRPAKGAMPVFEARLAHALDRLVLFKSSVPDYDRHRFVGTAIDGTVQLFTTLTKNEIKLLKFLESLCEPRLTANSLKASSLAQRIAKLYSSKLEGAGRIPPSAEATHARGDMLKALLEPGHYNLHYMLMKQVKLEDDEMKVEDDRLEKLENLARPVVGHGQQLIELVVAWLRRLLNVPSLS